MVMNQIKKRTKARVLLVKFFVPTPVELLPNLIVSLLILFVASYRALLVLLSNGTPITNVSFGEIYGQRLDYINEVLSTPLLGRVVLFGFWLGVGSIVYMLVWLFQNFAVEVYDDITLAKLKNPEAEQEDEEGWWGTTLAHTIFVGSSAILFLFYVLLVVNIFFPAFAQIFQVGLQNIAELGGWLQMVVGLLGTMLIIHIFVLFTKLFTRVKAYLYNTY